MVTLPHVVSEIFPVEIKTLKIHRKKTVSIMIMKLEQFVGLVSLYQTPIPLGGIFIRSRVIRVQI